MLTRFPAFFSRFPSLPALVLGGLVLIFYGLFLAHKIDLRTADLGRHLQNGRLAAEEHTIPHTNFYSYTEPEYPVVTHHWGSGMLFYLGWKAGGFAGVEVLFITVSVLTLAIFYGIGAAAAGPGPAAIIAALAMPMLAERTEVRPEAFSYLFVGLFFFILLQWQKKHPGRTSDWRLLALLPIIEILWVNTHIYFFLGYVLIAIFLATAFVKRPFELEKIKALGCVLIATIAASFINPFGISGAAAPFTIFENYGYRVAENQPVWVLETLLPSPNLTIFKILFATLIASFVLRAWRAKENRMSPVLAIVGVMVSAMAWLATRNFALFGFFFVPLVAANLAPVFLDWLDRRRWRVTMASGIVLVLAIIPGFFGQWQRYFPHWHEPGLGLEHNTENAASFFREHGLTGPIFNNYDIGGYLIWYLYGQEKVFVDNRPEAYPSVFFTDEYVPIQEKDDAWQKALAQWDFNTIFFSHRDMTPWAQKFLITRVTDRAWAPVYADHSAIIFVRRNEKDKDLIEKFEIPQSAFRMVQQ